MENATYCACQASVKLGEPVYDEVMEETLHPAEVSEQCLLKLLDENKDTEYGKRYGFADIHSVEEYQKHVPVITYDNIAADLERMAAGEKNILTAYPFDHMNETSGTIGAMKVVPMTDRQTKMFTKYNRLYTDAFMGRKLSPEWMQGRAFCTSEGCHRTLPSGITVGCASSKMVDYIGGPERANKYILTLYTSPLEASAPKPGTDSKYLHARFFLEDGEVTGIATGFFSLAVLYLKYISDNYKMLIEDIDNGTINPTVPMPSEVRESLQDRLFPNHKRAAELREIFRNGSDFPFLPLVWPKMQYICGVGADGFSNFDKTLSERYGGEKLIRIYSGITASEGLFSIPLDINNPDNVLAPGAGFMEFLPVEAGDDFSRIVTIDKLEVGKTYEIVYTNFSGFYRYRMSDAVQCTGYFNKTPLVQFMYRVNRTVNLVCEKTTEKALTAAVEKSMDELGIQMETYSMYPNADVFPVRYEFLIETSGAIPDIPLEKVSETINRNLCVFNAEYEDCMNVDHTIGKPVSYWLKSGSSMEFVDYMAAKGKSPSQQKPVKVITNELQRQFFYRMRINDSGMTKQLALQTIDRESERLVHISDSLWDKPENHFHEVRSSEMICKYLEENGFKVERGIAGIPTAFKATYGTSTPRIGILAEYDALPGLSQEACSFEKRPISGQSLGHGCGHNLMAGGCAGAAIAMKEYLQAYPERGTVVLFGCPDEEISGAKVFMARAGQFDNLDLALCWHPCDVNMVPFGTTSAVTDISYTFYGQSSHVAATFGEKQDALEGAELMNVGLQYLRNQVSDRAQIDYAFSDSGSKASNVVKDKVSIHYTVRTSKHKDMQEIVSRVDNLAKGASLMTNTDYSSEIIGGASGLIANPLLCNILYDNFVKSGLPEYTEEELSFAKKLLATGNFNQRTVSFIISQQDNPVIRQELMAKTGSPICNFIIPPTGHEISSPASSDVGDVSRICPVAQLCVATLPTGIPFHTWQAVSAGKSSMAHKGMLKAASVLAASAIDIFENLSLSAYASNEFRERTSGHKYVSPIPDSVVPDID